jgi:LacI family repressor for deo operon, udp, cdd, tsx, nupC, and nupG
MATKPTISDVAARAGVSKAAVSFALNNRPGVSSGTRERILLAAAELGFTANSSARALSNRRSGNIGLVMARAHETLSADPFFPAFIAGIESAIAPSGHFLLVRVVAEPAAESDAYRELARTGRVDGVVITDLRGDDERPALLDGLGLPAVTLNRATARSNATAVCVDDGPAVREAVRHLVEFGHTVIGHVGGPSTYLHAARRRDLWAESLRDHSMPEGPYIEADFSAAGGAAAAGSMLGAEIPPTAILFANDLMAVAGISAARRRGVRVPDDLSVVGFDDSELSAYLTAPLTTIRTDAYGWGRAVGSALLAKLDGAVLDDIDLPSAALIIRETSGPAPTRPARRGARHRTVTHPPALPRNTGEPPRRNPTRTAPRRPERERP